MRILQYSAERQTVHLHLPIFIASFNSFKFYYNSQKPISSLRANRFCLSCYPEVRYSSVPFGKNNGKYIGEAVNKAPEINHIPHGACVNIQKGIGDFILRNPPDDNQGNHHHCIKRNQPRAVKPQ